MRFPEENDRLSRGWFGIHGGKKVFEPFGINWFSAVICQETIKDLHMSHNNGQERCSVAHKTKQLDFLVSLNTVKKPSLGGLTLLDSWS